MHRATDVLLFALEHPRREFVFQPTYAAYLNLIEPWWKTLRSLALKGRRFGTWQEVCEAIDQATMYWNAHYHPFVWGRRRRHRPRRSSGIAIPANVRLFSGFVCVFAGRILIYLFLTIDIFINNITEMIFYMDSRRIIGENDKNYHKQSQRKLCQIDYATRPPENPKQQQQDLAKITECPTYAQVVRGKLQDSHATSREEVSRIVTDKKDTFDSAVDYVAVFSNFLKEPQENRTIEKIVALIPKNASGCRLSDKEYTYPLVGFQYTWTDPKDLAAGLMQRREWRIRVHEPYPNTPPEEKRWILRIKLDKNYMDVHGRFHKWNTSHRTQYYNPQIAEDTHIFIQTPDLYLSPLDHPEYYGW